MLHSVSKLAMIHGISEADLTDFAYSHNFNVNTDDDGIAMVSFEESIRLVEEFNRFENECDNHIGSFIEARF